MKASLKFREEQKPLFKSKVPISILGLPFQSGLIAGDSKELSLSLATFFEYGPCLRVSYRPNNPVNPFLLTIKSGIGQFGSPFNAPMTMSAEINILGENNKSSINPRFMIHFKPRFGDFCIKKSQSSLISDFGNKAEPKYGSVYEDDDGEVVEKSECFEVGRKMTSLPIRKTVETAMVGMEVGANTSLPIRNEAVLKFRWGVKFPAEGLRNWFNYPTNKILPRGVPMLVLNKIGIQHVAKADKKDVAAVASNGVTTRGSLSEGAELAEVCFGMKRELETLRFENAGLGSSLEELKAEFGRGRGGGRGGERKVFKGDGDENGEIQGVIKQ